MPDHEIRFGVIYSRLHEVVAIPRFAETVESLGFDSVWVTEGLVNELPALDILAALQAFALHTHKITVGTAVVLLPLRNPAILAKQVAAIDLLADGRVVLGFGVGGSRNSNPAAFELCGVPLEERGRRTDEALEIMTKLWTGMPVSHQGAFYNFAQMQMQPAPRQRPHPPLWSGGGTADPVLRRTARWCDGFLPTDVTPEEYPQLWERILGYAEQYDRDLTAATRALHIYVSLDESEQDARAVATRTLTERYGYDVALKDPDRYAFGTADDCAARIESYSSAGVTDFVFNVVQPLDQVLPQIERLANEVLPRFR
jgi:probable F420-dependent oxidoreductase